MGTDIFISVLLGPNIPDPEPAACLHAHYISHLLIAYPSWQGPDKKNAGSKSSSLTMGAAQAPVPGEPNPTLACPVWEENGHSRASTAELPFRVAWQMLT